MKSAKDAAATEEWALDVSHPDCHKAADAFWQYWRENGATHKHGYYESTWGAINQALRYVGVHPHTYGKPRIEVKGTTYLSDCDAATPTSQPADGASVAADGLLAVREYVDGALVEATGGKRAVLEDIDYILRVAEQAMLASQPQAAEPELPESIRESVLEYFRECDARREQAAGKDAAQAPDSGVNGPSQSQEPSPVAAPDAGAVALAEELASKIMAGLGMDIVGQDEGLDESLNDEEIQCVLDGLSALRSQPAREADNGGCMFTVEHDVLCLRTKDERLLWSRAVDDAGQYDTWPEIFSAFARGAGERT